MRRFASLDFQRGLAIFVMLFLHTVMFTFDLTLLDHLAELRLLSIIALVAVPFLGGLAGFFLLVSAIGNMVSMQRHLQAGRPVRALFVRQVAGGLILLLFAVLTEAVIGCNGAVGQWVRHYYDPGYHAAEIMVWRGFHFETIHTIAWCIILNGAVQALFSRHGARKDGASAIRKYALWAVVVVAITAPLWLLAGAIVPGYPYASYREMGIAPSDRWVEYPLEHVTRWWQLVELFLLAPVAGQPEPIFPYLSISFVGSIIGIWMSQSKEQRSPTLVPRLMLVSTGMFVVGAAGLAAGFARIRETLGTRAMLDAYQQLWDHRAFGPLGRVQMGTFGWLFQFLALNGFGLFGSLLILRLVELRGKGEAFGGSPTARYVRRFGFVAFSVYNYQYLEFLPWTLLSLSLGLGYYAYFSWPGVLAVWVLSLLVFQLVLRLWEKVGYVGSVEWMIGTLAALIVPSTKKPSVQEGGQGRRWYQLGMPDVAGAFHGPEWLDIVSEDEIRHDQLAESKLAFKLALLGFLIFPLAFLAHSIAKKSIVTERSNPYNARARVLAVVAMGFAATWIAAASVLTPEALGLR
ncbi:MAG TPA: hypothetical protein VLM85_23900 [Polyangiaceae bacterium]|nr:hypothetical protein [Polyangiaceae bacterium]